MQRVADSFDLANRFCVSQLVPGERIPGYNSAWSALVSGGQRFSVRRASKGDYLFLCRLLRRVVGKTPAPQIIPFKASMVLFARSGKAGQKRLFGIADAFVFQSLGSSLDSLAMQEPFGNVPLALLCCCGFFGFDLAANG